MVWPAVIAAGAALGASRLGQLGTEDTNRMNMRIARENNAASAAAAQRQMDFQSSMFDRSTQLENTAHQRQVSDLKAAGLNPMLSVPGGGAGAPSPPSGAMSTQHTPQLDNPMKHYSGIGSDLMNIAASATGIDKAQQETSKLVAETADAANRAGISGNEWTKSDALISAMIQHGLSVKEVPDEENKMDKTHHALSTYMRETVVKPQVQAQAAAMAAQMNEQKLQEFINMPAANGLMAAIQLALKVYLSGKSGSTK